MNVTALPGSRGVLFGVCTTNCSDYSLNVLDLATGEHHVVAADGLQGMYLPTGHLLYTKTNGTGVAAPFDLGALAVTGPAVQVIEGVVPLSPLAVSANGTLVYWYGSMAGGGQREFVRVDRNGTRTRMDSTWHGLFTNGEFSPTGDRFVTAVGVESGTQNIWIKQLETGAFSPLTSGRTDRRPIWSPDGRTIAFIHDSASVGQVYIQPVDGSRPAAPAFRFDRSVQELDWSPDGAWIVVRTDNGEAGSGDILAIPTSGDPTPVPITATPAAEYYPVISPDGRWIAYTSEESGRSEVYVARFPTAGSTRWQVSLSGGIQPRWSPDGRELFYIVSPFTATTNTAGTMTAAELRLGEGVEVLARRGLFQTDGLNFEGIHQSYDIDPRDGRFSFLRAHRDSTTVSRLSLVRVEHWFDVLRERLAQ